MVGIILTILSLPAVWALLIKGHFQPHDLHHLADIYEMSRALIGQFPPRWAPDFTHGFGYPLYNFYYLLPFYFGSVFYLLLGSLTESLKLVFLTCFAISIWGMYRFLREFSSKWASIVGAVVFTYTPYRAVQIYVRGAVGEAFSLAFLPVASYFLVKLVKNPTTKNIGKASLALALLLSTHNYMWFLSLPFVYILLLLITQKKQFIKSVKALTITSLLGLGSVAFWIFPAILELKHVPRLTPFLLEDHFPFMKQLIYSPWGYGASNWGPYDDLSFQIGIVNLIAVSLLGLIFIFKYKKLKFENKKIIIWVLASFGISIIFMNVRTLSIWKLLPIYNFVQFPWRLLFLTSFFSSIAAALVIDLLPKFNKKLGIIFIILCIFLTRDYFKPSGRFYHNDQHYFSLFFNDPNYSEDYLLLTEWADERPVEAPNSKFELTSTGEINTVKQSSPVNWSANIITEEDTVITFNNYYFPGWYAKVDGELVDIVPGKPYGQITLLVPAGEHAVNIYWAETPMRKAFDVISLISLASISYLLFREKK